jgi:MFS family permease
MALLANDMRLVFWVAAVPALISVLLVVFAVDEPAVPHGAAGAPRMKRGELKGLGRGFWWVVAIGVVFTLARFSEAFLVLKASADGLALGLAPLVLVVMSLVYSLGAYPAGILSDRIAAPWLLLAGLAALLAADLVLALGAGLGATFAGIALWGLHMALTQGLLSKMVADQVEPRLRGSAFGLFGLATGLAMLGASALAGLLWTWKGPDATFLAGAGFAAAAALMVLALRARV